MSNNVIAACVLFAVLVLIGLQAYWWRKDSREDRYFLLAGKRTKRERD